MRGFRRGRGLAALATFAVYSVERQPHAHPGMDREEREEAKSGGHSPTPGLTANGAKRREERRPLSHPGINREEAKKRTVEVWSFARTART